MPNTSPTEEEIRLWVAWQKLESGIERTFEGIRQRLKTVTRSTSDSEIDDPVDRKLWRLLRGIHGHDMKNVHIPSERSLRRYVCKIENDADAIGRMRALFGITSSSQNEGPGVSRVQGSTVTSHSEMLHRIADDLITEVAASPPVPSELFAIDDFGNITRWKPFHTFPLVTGSSLAYSALAEHLQPTILRSVIEGLEDGLREYRSQAEHAINILNQELDFIEDEVFRRLTGVATFKVAADWNCYNSERYGGTWESAQDEFEYLTQMPLTLTSTKGSSIALVRDLVHDPDRFPDDADVLHGTVLVRIGPFKLGEIRGDDAAVIAREVGSRILKVRESIVKEQVTTPVAETFFDLLELFKSAMVQLKLIGIHDYIHNGTCRFCLTSE